jgi:hypothetical protein
MPLRCKRCEYDRTGLPAGTRCPECGGLHTYFDRPTDWSRFLRWPGVLAPIGAVVCAAGCGLLAARVGGIAGPTVMFEGLMVVGLGFVNWE